VCDAGVALVLHDVLCPLTPASFLSRAVDTAVGSERVVVGGRPVVDTIKTVVDGALGQTLDRALLYEVTSPVVLPASAVAALPDWPDTADVAALVNALRDLFEVGLLDAPAGARRVVDDSGLLVLEARASDLRQT